ncbi:alpha/beta hydrolase [Slackia heliotrinireducens]|uniref:alpha/beta hydrolase n=1 Tax=Slackia heliotrinireducens TaxID=84110 RepID=UPI0033160B19
MISLKPDKDIQVRTVAISADGRTIPALVLSPKQGARNATGVLWIHGGGYFLGMKEMVHMSRAVDLVKRFGAVVVSPGYRMALLHPYPAAVDDCYTALAYLYEHADELGVRRDQIMVGGESAGGGLCAAVCMMARDRGVIPVAFHMPLYPMMDNFDTETSRDNHGRVWNTRRNHLGWRLYLRSHAHDQVSPYAAPARQTRFEGLPPAYTFVGKSEPFYAETLAYIENLRAAGVSAHVDTYDTDMHAFDMLNPKGPESVKAIAAFLERFAYAQAHCFADETVQ